MNIDLVGKVQPFYVAENGSIQCAAGNVIGKDWAEIVITLKNGDSMSLLRGENFKKLKDKTLIVDEEYIFGMHFSVGMCYRSGRNLSVLTASLEYFESV